jgi:hypothetical protein
VPPRHVAIVLADGGPTTFGPGDHSLPNWPLPAPEVILLDAGPLPCELQWDGLPAGDAEPVTLTAGLDVTVADPLRLHDAWLRTSAGPDWRLPEDVVAGRLRDRAAQLVGGYAAADLGRPAVQERLAGELRGPLAAELARYGLAPASPALTIGCLTLAEREAARQAARAARELAGDAAMAEAFSRLEDRDAFLDRIATWEERTGEKLDAATVEALWRQVAPDGLPLPTPEPAAEAAPAVVELLQERADALEAVAAAQPLPPERRFEQQLADLDAPIQPFPESPSERLNQLYRVLRLVAATVGCGWAAFGALTHGFGSGNAVQMIIEGLGLVVATVGMGAALVTYSQAQRRNTSYWQAVGAQMAGQPAGAALAQRRQRSRLLYLVADVLILLALVVGLLLWLNGHTGLWLAPSALAFGVAFALVLIARGGDQVTRRQVEALLAQPAPPTLAARRTADDLVRRQVREYLGRVATNLEEAGRAFFRLGPAGQDVSVALRRLRTGPLTVCQTEAQEFHYRDVRYFADAWVPDEQLSRMLALDTDLLRRAHDLALASETLYQASVDGDAPRCAASAASLDKDVNQLRRVLGERAAFIGGTDR